MAWCTRHMIGALVAVGALGSWGCSETTKPPPPVTSVVVTSPIGLRLAVGRTVQLTASARDASGTPVPGVTVTWTSSAPAVASVTSAGLVTGVDSGTAKITAQATGVSGSIIEQVLAADLGGAKALLADPFAGALLGGLTGGLKAPLQGALGQCAGGMDAGNFDTMDAAMDSARNVMARASDPTDQALTATLALFVDQVYRLLRL
jgi:Big-like domain-containing protein